MSDGLLENIFFYLLMYFYLYTLRNLNFINTALLGMHAAYVAVLNFRKYQQPWLLIPFFV